MTLGGAKPDHPERVPPLRLFGATLSGPAAAFLVTLGCGVAFGCASGGSGEPVYAVSRVDTAPDLRGCGDYRDPNTPAGSGVELSFVVDEAGDVIASTIAARDSRRTPLSGDSQDEIEEAKEALLTCSFTPGLLNGEPVRVRMSKTFKFAGLP